MKKLALILFVTMIALSVSAQIPQALNYQAIARNSLGQIIPSQNVGVRFTVLDLTGTNILYQETHNSNTNNFGLFTLAIGKGTAISGTFPTIDWSAAGDKYLKVEIAPQGGTNYTIQGITQLLSVPYALYSEKTKLIGGNAVTITNGNTINANYIAGTAINITGNTISGNYQAGPGINITGNIISAIAANPWLLNGNTATTAANFLGTTDNQPLVVKTNNLQRLSISESNIVGSNNISYVTAGQQSNFSTNPIQLSVWGKDISGSALPFGIAGSVAGMNWSSNGGSNNTLGRLMRLSQFTTTSGSDYQFYDVGIDQSGDYFIGEHQSWNGGNITPKKMFTISPQDFVGVNFNWGEHPTANFHTKGSLRFEGVNTNNALTRVIVMDANGNVASRDASTIGSGGNNWSLLGNTGTTAANFLGTTDNIALNLRVNNGQRFSISPVTTVGSYNVSYMTAGDVSATSNNPTQFSVHGKDISGSMLPFGVNASIVGMTWSQIGGSNNTLGRLVRWTQWTSNSNNQFYDQGIDQEGDFFITARGLSGSGGFLPKKMLQISSTDNVGINMDWAENPTANFHTKGTLRFEGVNTNNALTRLLVMDANGNVSSRDASTLGGSFWVADANGIHNNNASGNVAIGTNSKTDTKLVVMGTGDYAAEINSTLTWQTALNLRNTSSSSWRWAMVTGGSANNQPLEGVGQGNFGIANDNTNSLNTTYPLIISTDDKVGIGMGQGGSTNAPKTQLHVKTGDIYIEQVTSGVIMKSPNGQCWRMAVSNAGAPVFTAIPCP
jgi:hypothetical protein